MKRVETEPIVVVLERSELLPERRRKEAICLTLAGLVVSGHTWTLLHSADAVCFREEDGAVRSERAGE